MNILPVVPLNGLRADSLGSYLASLGLFSVTTQEWPRIRAVWRNGSFCLVGGPADLEQVVECVGGIGERSSWSIYEKLWEKTKKEDVAKQVSVQTARWRGLEAKESSLRMFGAHLALDGRIRMNPLLGTGGNAGKRDFSRGWKAAVQVIKIPPRGQSRDTLNNDLRSLLSGKACAYLGSFQAGSWFGAANKIYNHGNLSAPSNSPRGTKQPYREGEITPWAMALACEGLSYFAGSTSRQLGSHRQPKGAFPFITEAMAPQGSDEAGSVEAEVWAPIWEQPMTEPELRSLFLRGRTELGGKGAISPSAFAVGITSRGVDAGILEFRRFLLLHTTSAQTFESRLATTVPVPKTNLDSATTQAVHTIFAFHETLPVDRKVGKRWKFSGLRGPLEQALVDFAATVPVAGHVEQAWALVDGMFATLIKVDRNRKFRTYNVRFQLLPGEWAAKLFHQDPPCQEARLALAVSSLYGTTRCPPAIAYRVGVEKKDGRLRWEFPESPPARRVWNDAELTDNLGSMAERRTMDALKKPAPHPPFGASIKVGLEDVHSWLSADLDEELMGLWLNRFCMFDWSSEPGGEAAKELQRSFPRARPAVDDMLAIYALFRPLMSDWLFHKILHESGVQADGTSTCARLGRAIAMLRHGDVNAATEEALATYRSAGVALADFNVLPDGYNPGRLLAALVIPTRDEQVLAIFRRWRAPTKPNEQ